MISRSFFLFALTLAAGAAIAFAQDASKATAKAASSPVPTVRLSEQEHHDLQALLEGRLAREREYRESLLAAQGAQARFDAATSATEAAFYKLCAKYKLDPDGHELTSDAKAIQPKTVTAETPKADAKKRQ